MIIPTKTNNRTDERKFIIFKILQMHLCFGHTKQKNELHSLKKSIFRILLDTALSNPLKKKSSQVTLTRLILQ